MGQTIFSILYIDTLDAIIRTGSITFIAFRMTNATRFFIHFISVWQDVTRFQACAIEFEMFAFETLFGSKTPATIRRTFIGTLQAFQF